jgi:THO complex subunit 5
VALYSLDEFKSLAPWDSRTDDEHQLMLNRLNFEFTERQRYSCTLSHVSLPNRFLSRLDAKKKDLSQQKELLLKESKAKSTTIESVKSQIDILMKVPLMLSYPLYIP